MRTVIVDDEQWMLSYFEYESAGIEGIELITSFRNPRAALKYLLRNDIDLVFLDYEMPVMNGEILARRLRDTVLGVKIVFLCASDEHKDKLLRSGLVDYFLAKPYSSEDLAEVMEKLLGLTC